MPRSVQDGIWLTQAKYGTAKEYISWNLIFLLFFLVLLSRSVVILPENGPPSGCETPSERVGRQAGLGTIEDAVFCRPGVAL